MLQGTSKMGSDGQMHPITQGQIFQEALHVLFLTLLFGSIPTTCLVLAAYGAARFFRAMALPAAIVGCVIFGGGAGIVLSILALGLVGGMSPPLILSCFVAGMVAFILVGDFRPHVAERETV
jgi:hypothetical protein